MDSKSFLHIPFKMISSCLYVWKIVLVLLSCAVCYIWQNAWGWFGDRTSSAHKGTWRILCHGTQVSTLWCSAGQRWGVKLCGHSGCVVTTSIKWTECKFFWFYLSGVLSKGRVRCPWHGACFNIATGDIEDFPGLDSLPTFQVFILGFLSAWQA